MYNRDRMYNITILQSNMFVIYSKNTSMNVLIWLVCVCYLWVTWLIYNYGVRHSITTNYHTTKLSHVDILLTEYQSILDKNRKLFRAKYAHKENYSEMDESTRHRPKIKKMEIEFVRENNLESVLNPNNKLTEDAFYGPGCGGNPFRRRLQKLLKNWMKLMAHSNLEYFLCYGSLMGYQRTKDFIPYDHDIDICLNEKDFPSLIKKESQRPINVRDKLPHTIIARSFVNGKRLNCEGVLVDTKMDPCSIVSPAARIILGQYNFIDVYLYKTGHVYNPYPELQFDEREIYPIRSCSFADIITRCPSNSDSLLRKFYGLESIEKPHHICINGQFVATGTNVTERKLDWLVEKIKQFKNKRKREKKLS